MSASVFILRNDGQLDASQAVPFNVNLAFDFETSMAHMSQVILRAER
jgi:hypothetical protein